MFTRAYDVIMQALQTPVELIADTFSSTLDDKYLNCKNYAGVVRNIGFSNINGTSFTTQSANIAVAIPFIYMAPNVSLSYASAIQIDEDSTTPNYEDYACSNASYPPGWSNSGGAKTTQTKNDDGSLTTTYKCSYKNTTNNPKIVYGIKVVGDAYYRSSATSSPSSKDYFLLAREHFAEPIEVAAEGIIELSISWTTHRGGSSSLSVSA